MKKETQTYNYKFLDRMAILNRDIMNMFSKQRANRIQRRVNEIIIDEPDIVQYYYGKTRYESSYFDKRKNGEFGALKEIFMRMNTDKEIHWDLRDGMSTVLAKLAILTKYSPEMIDTYLLEGDKSSGNQYFSLNEEFARMLILATVNNYESSDTIGTVLNKDGMKLDTNFNGSLNPGVSVAITSYIENSSALKEFTECFMHEGFFEELNVAIGRISSFDLCYRFNYWSDEFEPEVKHRKIRSVFNSMSMLHKIAFDFSNAQDQDCLGNSHQQYREAVKNAKQLAKVNK